MAGYIYTGVYMYKGVSPLVMAECMLGQDSSLLPHKVVGCFFSCHLWTKSPGFLCSSETGWSVHAKECWREEQKWGPSVTRLVSDMDLQSAGMFTLCSAVKCERFSSHCWQCCYFHVAQCSGEASLNLYCVSIVMCWGCSRGWCSGYHCQAKTSLLLAKIAP